MTLEEAVGPSYRFPPSKPRSFDYRGLSGRIVEFSGWNHSAGISLTVPLIQECQNENRLCAWVAPRTETGETLFFPPDFASAGIDCNRIPILWADSPMDGFGIIEKLLRSGGLGMIVIDLTEVQRRRYPNLGRIHNLAQKFESLVLCLTRKRPGDASLDPMVFLHVHGSARRSTAGVYEVEARIQKDKNNAPGKLLRRIYEAPIGLP